MRRFAYCQEIVKSRRIEAKGYALVALHILTPTREMRAEHEGKPFSNRCSSS